MAILREESVRNATLPNGQGAGNAKRYVYAANSDNLAVLFEDRHLTHTLANPMTADGSGNFEIFYLNDGAYRVLISDENGRTLIEADNIQADSAIVNTDAQRFKTVQALLEDSWLSYSSNGGRISISPGDHIMVSDGAFSYRIEDEAATNFHLETAGGLKLSCLPNSSGGITVRQLGGAEGADITQILQAAIVCASSWETGSAPLASNVLIDLQDAVLSDTIHVHFGASPSGNVQYRGVNVTGFGRKYATESIHMGTRLRFTATDRPAFVIQNGRNIQLGGFSLHGAARVSLSAADYTSLDMRSETGWDTALSAAGVTPNRRYAPYAGIAIDPYTGPKPSNHYPDADAFGWLPGKDLYDVEGGSSNTGIFDVALEGFEVGIVQQPGDASSNSDLAVFRDVDFRFCKYGDSIGTSQCRNTTRQHCTYNRVWSLMTNHHHGQRIGTAAGSFNNCSAGGFIGRLFDLNSLSYGGGLVFNELDVESLWQVGHIAAPNSGETELLLKMCQINFSHDGTDIFPGQIISGASLGTVRFEACTVSGYGSVLTTLNLPEALQLGTTFIPNESRDKDYKRLAHNFLAGGLVPNLLGVKEQSIRFVPQIVGGGTRQGTMLTSSYRYTNRDHCLPLVAEYTTYYDRYLERIRIPARRASYQTRNIGNHFTVTDITDRTITIDLSGQFSNEQNILQRGYLPGDVAVHEPTGTVMFIRSADDSGSAGSTYAGGTGEVILEMQNNYYKDGSDYVPLDMSFLDNNQKWVFLPSRIYAPNVPLLGQIDSASSKISVAKPSGYISTDYGLAVGDCYWEDQDVYATFPSTGRAIITGIDTATSEISMGGNASQALFNHNFAFWCRQPPANQTSR